MTRFNQTQARRNGIHNLYLNFSEAEKRDDDEFVADKIEECLRKARAYLDAVSVFLHAFTLLASPPDIIEIGEYYYGNSFTDGNNVVQIRTLVDQIRAGFDCDVTIKVGPFIQMQYSGRRPTWNKDTNTFNVMETTKVGYKAKFLQPKGLVVLHEVPTDAELELHPTKFPLGKKFPGPHHVQHKRGDTTFLAGLVKIKADRAIASRVGDDLLVTLIHETSHRICDTKDHFYTFSVQGTPGFMDKGRRARPFDQLLDNADTVAFFVATSGAKLLGEPTDHLTKRLKDISDTIKAQRPPKTSRDDFFEKRSDQDGSGSDSDGERPAKKKPLHGQ